MFGQNVYGRSRPAVSSGEVVDHVGAPIIAADLCVLVCDAHVWSKGA